MDIMTGMFNDMIVSTEDTETDGKLHRSYEDNKILCEKKTLHLYSYLEQS